VFPCLVRNLYNQDDDEDDDDEDDEKVGNNEDDDEDSDKVDALKDSEALSPNCVDQVRG
jgi:hypothetical protein